MKRILFFILMMGTVPLQAAQEDENDSYIQISKTVLAVGAAVLPIASYHATQLVRSARDILFLDAIKHKNCRRVEFFLRVLRCDPNYLFLHSLFTTAQKEHVHAQGWPLHDAVKTGLPEMVDVLLKYRARDCFNGEGTTALHAAAKPYNPAIFVALLEGYKQQKSPNRCYDHCRGALDGLYQHALDHLYTKAMEDKKRQEKGERFTPPTLPQLSWK